MDPIKHIFNDKYRQFIKDGDDWDCAFSKAMIHIIDLDYPENIIHQFIDEISTNLSPYGLTISPDSVRCCSICGRPMFEGYLAEDIGEYYCSDKCLLQSYEGDIDGMNEDLSHAEEDNAPLFWTEWEEDGIFFDV